jgi:tetratricopeptide (TPR) repeat protein
VSLDPGNIDALVWIASVDVVIGAGLLSADRVERLATAEAVVTKVLSLTPDHAVAHLQLGAIQNFTNRAAQGIAECERALALDRNNANAHGQIGFAKIALGRNEETAKHIQDALRLSPRDPFAYFWTTFAGAAKLHLGRYEEAIEWLRRSIELMHVSLGQVSIAATTRSIAYGPNGLKTAGASFGAGPHPWVREPHYSPPSLAASSGLQRATSTRLSASARSTRTAGFCRSR